MKVAVVARARSRLTGFHATLAELLDATVAPDGHAEAEALLLLGSATWYPKTWKRLHGQRVALWHTEPLPLPASANRRLARRHLRELAKVALRDPRRSDPRSNWRRLQRVAPLVDLLVVSTYERKLFLAEHGVDAAFVPLGYDEQWHGGDRKRERDIDVLFLGALDVPRRRQIIRRLRRDGVDVTALGDWSDPRLWGEQRVELLNRTKILLNLPRHPGMLSGGRMLLGMANKALIVAEPIFEPRPYVPGMHFVSAPVGEMAGVIRRYLEDDDARTALTDTAHAFATQELTLQRSVASIAELFARRVTPGAVARP